ncbi:MAG: hypothetical protein R8N23_04220 [Reichenbachiella sp.]|uniref:hypothetical protein n=1 Tax=Reichenbachiella sp. TaxID=2184521 RepID=UPI002966FB5E|nr:hypothetical protein [Reichenbachiella sp.]MDW3209046.1 hypothetical protein [Reichenbachiella sp.]
MKAPELLEESEQKVLDLEYVMRLSKRLFDNMEDDFKNPFATPPKFIILLN